MPRKTDEEWAVLAVPQARLAKALSDKQLSIRAAARLCGHRSHSHLHRLINDPATKTTSLQTAEVLEAITDCRGQLFARTSVRTLDRTAA